MKKKTIVIICVVAAIAVIAAAVVLCITHRDPETPGSGTTTVVPASTTVPTTETPTTAEPVVTSAIAEPTTAPEVTTTVPTTADPETTDAPVSSGADVTTANPEDTNTPESTNVPESTNTPETTKTPETAPVVTCKHTHTELKNRVIPTCKFTGYSGDTVCLDCGATVTKGRVLAKEEHIADDPKNVRAATCGTVGYTGDIYCFFCGELMQTGHTIPVTGEHHLVYKAAVPATCVTGGMTAGYRCEYCDDNYLGDVQDALGKQHLSPDQLSQNTPRIDHTRVVDPAVASHDCKTLGKSEGSHCSVCGKVLEPQYPTMNGAHDFSVLVEHHAATANDYGFDVYKCSKCGKIDPNGHNVTWPVGVTNKNWSKTTTNYGPYPNMEVGEDYPTYMQQGYFGAPTTANPLATTAYSEPSFYYHPMDTFYATHGTDPTVYLPAVLRARNGDWVYGYWYYNQNADDDARYGIPNPGFTFVVDGNYIDPTKPTYGWCYHPLLNELVWGWYEKNYTRDGLFHPLDTLFNDTKYGMNGIHVNVEGLDIVYAIALGNLRTVPEYYKPILADIKAGKR